MKNKVWYHYDSGFACAAIITDEAGKIVETAPIFRKLVGRHISYLTYGKLTALPEAKGLTSFSAHNTSAVFSLIPVRPSWCDRLD